MTRIGLKAGEQSRNLRLGWVAVVALTSTFGAIGCSKNEAVQVDTGSEGGAVHGPDAGAQGGSILTDASVVGTIIVSAGNRRPRTTTWSVNYWTWMPSLGDDVSGTEVQVAGLKPAILRVGGYNNDVNTPDAFNNAQLDKAVMYAHAIGAEPLIQVPLVADIDGRPPTAVKTAAAMVTYANVTQGYGIKYFSIGNEPDLYATVSPRTDSTKPAIPNYLPSDYCASARAYVTAMKAVDPSIKIVGPDLSWQYVTGSDWLTQILQGCGDLFDIVSIHRLAFDSTQTTLDAAMADATTFDNVLTSVRALMQAAGAGDKPLALTAMNIAYNATTCVSGASPGTVGSALWLADGLGTAIEHDLWTSAVWNISDDDGWALGLIGLPPSHTPRPAYYAYQFFAEHFGPTLVDVSQQPQGIRTYASRNRADDTTDLIVINWSTSSAPLAFQVTGLPKTPAAATYTLPALSITAVAIPDNGASLAWTYNEAQHRAGQGPVALDPGASAAIDAGAPQDNACASDASVTCSKVVLGNASITTRGKNILGAVDFAPAPYQWKSYTFAASDQSAPSATVTLDGNGIHFTGGIVPPVNANYSGVGLYFDSLSCIDGSNYTGVKFDFSGDLGGCSLNFGVNFSGDSDSSYTQGSCSLGDSCYPPGSDVTPLSGSASGVRVPFASLGGGSPNPKLDPTAITQVQWQLSAPSNNVGCTANFTVENVAFY